MEISIKTKDALKTTETAKVETKSEIKPFKGNELVPALWTITPVEDGVIATNSTTGSKFEGTIAEFNAKLRG